jgi:hypothetical protein
MNSGDPIISAIKLYVGFGDVDHIIKGLMTALNV